MLINFNMFVSSMNFAFLELSCGRIGNVKFVHSLVISHFECGYWSDEIHNEQTWPGPHIGLIATKWGSFRSGNEILTSLIGRNWNKVLGQRKRAIGIRIFIGCDGRTE